MTTFEILAIIVFLNVMATIELWRRAARRPEKLKRRFLKRVWDSKPITPKHEPPPPLKADAWGVGKQELQFFDDFEDFANVVNWWLSDPDLADSPWRLQELPKSQLVAVGHDGPNYGRTYAVFHNQVRFGRIELMPLWDYSAETPRVIAHISLDWPRLLALGTIRGFLIAIAQHISEYHPRTVEYLQTNQNIDLALTDVLWETQEISQFGIEPGYGHIELELSGLAKFYFMRRQLFRNQAAKAAELKARP